MATVQQFLAGLRTINIAPGGPRVEQTIAEELCAGPMKGAAIRHSSGGRISDSTLRVAVLGGTEAAAVDHRLSALPQWALFRTHEGGGAEILASASHLLFWLYTHVAEEWGSTPAEEHRGGTLLTPTF